MKATSLYNLLEYFINSTFLVVQFKAFTFILNSLFKSRAANTSLVIKIPPSLLNVFCYFSSYYYFISFLVNTFISFAIQMKYLINLLQQLARPKNFLAFFIFFGFDQLSILFTFFFSILILLGSMITFRNLIFYTFHIHFFGLIYKLFSSSLFSTFFTISLYPSFVFVPISTLSTKAVTFSLLIMSFRISFIIAQNIAGKFVIPKNITVGSKNSTWIINAPFHLSLFFIIKPLPKIHFSEYSFAPYIVY